MTIKTRFRCGVLFASMMSTNLWGNSDTPPNNTNNDKPPSRILTLQGKVDSRLRMAVITAYRPTDHTNTKACTRSDWNTARRKGVLAWDVQMISEGDKNNGMVDYKAEVPIDYSGKDLCGYEFSVTSLVIRWHNHVYKGYI